MQTVLTNDLKKGDMVLMKNGWKARIEDNRKGNIRFATVFGNYTEMGSIYAMDIKAKIDGDKLIPVILTKKQQDSKAKINAFFGL